MRGFALALASPLAFATGCVSLEPSPPSTRYYVLEAEPSEPGPSRQPVELLGVGPVRLPPYLDRPELVTREGAGRVAVANLDRWAAPLDQLFASALAEDLRATVPGAEVLAWPWPAGVTPKASVAVDVLRFEGEADGTAVLRARWTVRRADGAVRQGMTSARERPTAPGPAGTVPALGRAIGLLARDVATAVEELREAAGK